MSGHSKWNNIKNRKAAVDSKKGKVFGQLARLIKIAVKEGKSGDANSNPTLRTLLDKARIANMPKEKIQKAIDVGLGKSGGSNIKEVIYEGYGPGGIGMLIVSLTNNSNRTTSELKTMLSKAGGSLGSPGSVMYMFKRGQEDDYICTMPLEVNDANSKKNLENLVDQLLIHDDVENVYTSMKE
jgi:YebC/PmpR family DNA-binding regulatory protein